MRKFILSACAAALATSVQAASVWKVENGSNTLYLGGTLHILSPSDYPLPAPYEEAYKEADTLVFETDIGALTSPEFAEKSASLLTYSGTKTLKDNINDKTLAALAEHLKSRGVPLERFMKLKPALVGISLSLMEYQRIGLTSQGVDNYFYTKGMGEGKTLDWFETPEDQLGFIVKLGEGEEDAYIQYTLDDLEKMPGMVGEMKEDWRKGDMASLYVNNIEEIVAEYPSIYENLLTERNTNWLPKLKALMATPETEFVLVGTLHMPGKDGVLDLLKREGYTITQLSE
ncbi:TraB/GumN family protein [Alteromonas pelagimontana]|uniref:TraB/GumN family protein n=1 Tax=Alteromonas pelagimontana TaxID=1858656 RepID=A0A6M4MGK5_9ALTE|nr:TraB/GumN family protein [Alteromonas pelagimontana]QJR82192.1 TraB/GumN family protein [Alteromonas pelagimontana]